MGLQRVIHDSYKEIKSRVLWKMKWSQPQDQIAAGSQQFWNADPDEEFAQNSHWRGQGIAHQTLVSDHRYAYFLLQK